MPITTVVQVDLDGAPPQPVAAECPTCFALVIRTHLSEHEQAVHNAAARKAYESLQQAYKDQAAGV